MFYNHSKLEFSMIILQYRTQYY